MIQWVPDSTWLWCCAAPLGLPEGTDVARICCPVTLSISYSAALNEAEYKSVSNPKSYPTGLHRISLSKCIFRFRWISSNKYPKYNCISKSSVKNYSFWVRDSETSPVNALRLSYRGNKITPFDLNAGEIEFVWKHNKSVASVYSNSHEYH